MFYVDVQKVKGRMVEKGYTNSSFAEKIGVSRNTLATYLSNPSRIPYDVLERIADALFDNVVEARDILFAQKLA